MIKFPDIKTMRDGEFILVEYTHSMTPDITKTDYIIKREDNDRPFIVPENANINPFDVLLYKLSCGTMGFVPSMDATLRYTTKVVKSWEDKEILRWHTNTGHTMADIILIGEQHEIDV